MIYNITNLIDMDQLRLLCKLLIPALLFCAFILKLLELTWLNYIERS